MTNGVGAFGKMPSVGDFFRINTPSGFVSVWDEWLQTGMLDAQSVLGEEWNNAFLSAPIWRFSLASGVAGETAVMGVLMPSVDRVGRQFPMTLVAPFAGDAIADHLRLTQQFVAMETVALATLDDMPKDTLATHLAGLTCGGLPPLARICDSGGILTSVASGGGTVAEDLAATCLADRTAATTAWSTQLSDSNRLLLCQGLPGPRGFRALISLQSELWAEGA